VSRGALLLNAAIGVGRVSGPEWLAGEELPRIYEKHFGRPAITRSGSPEVDAQYVEFAMRELARMGVDYAPESVIRALSRARNSKTRRVGKSI